MLPPQLAIAVATEPICAGPSDGAEHGDDDAERAFGRGRVHRADVDAEPAARSEGLEPVEGHRVGDLGHDTEREEVPDDDLLDVGDRRARARRAAPSGRR